MLLLISTGEDEVDRANIELIAENVYTKTIQMHNDYVKQLAENAK